MFGDALALEVTAVLLERRHEYILKLNVICLKHSN